MAVGLGDDHVRDHVAAATKQDKGTSCWRRGQCEHESGQGGTQTRAAGARARGGRGAGYAQSCARKGETALKKLFVKKFSRSRALDAFLCTGVCRSGAQKLLRLSLSLRGSRCPARARHMSLRTAMSGSNARASLFGGATAVRVGRRRARLCACGAGHLAARRPPPCAAPTPAGALAGGGLRRGRRGGTGRAGERQ